MTGKTRDSNTRHHWRALWLSIRRIGKTVASTITVVGTAGNIALVFLLSAAPTVYDIHMMKSLLPGNMSLIQYSSSSEVAAQDIGIDISRSPLDEDGVRNLLALIRDNDDMYAVLQPFTLFRVESESDADDDSTALIVASDEVLSRWNTSSQHPAVVGSSKPHMLGGITFQPAQGRDVTLYASPSGYVQRLGSEKTLLLSVDKYTPVRLPFSELSQSIVCQCSAVELSARLKQSGIANTGEAVRAIPYSSRLAEKWLETRMEILFVLIGIAMLLLVCVVVVFASETHWKLTRHELSVERLHGCSRWFLLMRSHAFLAVVFTVPLTIFGVGAAGLAGLVNGPTMPVTPFALLLVVAAALHVILSIPINVRVARIDNIVIPVVKSGS